MDPDAMQSLKDCIPLTADGHAVHYVEAFVAMVRNAYSYDPSVTNWTDTSQSQEKALKDFVVEIGASYPTIYAVCPFINPCFYGSVFVLL